jgi:hypothetical protein
MRSSNSLGWHRLTWLLDNPLKSVNVKGGECTVLQKGTQTVIDLNIHVYDHCAANPLSANIISEMHIGPVYLKYSKMRGQTVPY